MHLREPGRIRQLLLRDGKPIPPFTAEPRQFQSGREFTQGMCQALLSSSPPGIHAPLAVDRTINERIYPQGPPNSGMLVEERYYLADRNSGDLALRHGFDAVIRNFQHRALQKARHLKATCCTGPVAPSEPTARLRWNA